MRAGGARPRRARAAARAARRRATGRSFEALLASERVLASVCEAVIGAAYLAFGCDRVAPAVVAAFEGEIEEALENPVDFKSVLQERARAARRGRRLPDRSRRGPPHDRRFVARRRGRRRGARPRRGPDQEGRRAGGRRAGRSSSSRRGRRLMHLRSISMKGFKSFPDRTKLEFAPGVSVVVGPERLGQVEHHRRRPVGARRAEPARGARPDDAGRDLRRRPRREGRRAPPRSRW